MSDKMSSPEKKSNDGFVTADYAWELLATKFPQRYSTVRRAFIELDSDKDGVINMKEFRHAMEIIGLKMTGAEFRNLWRKFDTSGDGNISYTEFNNKMGRLITPVSNGLDMKRPETPKLKPWQEKAIAKQMARKVQDIDATFAMFDSDASGRINHAEFTQALRKLGLHLADAESYAMMQKYKQARPAKAGFKAGADGEDGGGLEITIDEFRAAMQDYLRVAQGPLDPADTDDVLKGAEELVAKHMPKTMGIERICNIFKRFDEFKNKEVTYDGFRAGLESVGIKLTGEQFQALVGKADPIRDGIINYESWAVDWSGGNPTAGTLHGGIAVYRPWARLGIRPVTDPITGKPYDRQALAERFAPALGLSVAETKLIQSLIGRKQDLMASFAAFDKDGSGELTLDEFTTALERMDAGLDSSAELVKALFERFDTNRNGRIEWQEWWGKVGGFMGLSDSNLRRLGLEKLTARECVAMGIDFRQVEATRNASNASLETLSRDVASAFRLDPGSPMARTAPGSPRARSNPPGLSGRAGNSVAARALAASGGLGGGGGDNKSVATDAYDLSSTGHKMKKVLGRNWMAVAADVQRRAATKAAELGIDLPSSSPAKGGAVPGVLLRDALAEKGVALTSKEVRAIAGRYAAPGTSRGPRLGADGKVLVPTREELERAPVDLEKLFIDAASGTMAMPKGADKPKIPTRRG